MREDGYSTYLIRKTFRLMDDEIIKAALGKKYDIDYPLWANILNKGEVMETRDFNKQDLIKAVTVINEYIEPQLETANKHIELGDALALLYDFVEAKFSDEPLE